MKCFNRILIFDFGTSKTRVCEDGKIVFDEPTEISYFSDGHIHIGYKARGFYSMHYDVINPITTVLRHRRGKRTSFLTTLVTYASKAS